MADKLTSRPLADFPFRSLENMRSFDAQRLAVVRVGRVQIPEPSPIRQHVTREVE